MFLKPAAITKVPRLVVTVSLKKQEWNRVCGENLPQDLLPPRDSIHFLLDQIPLVNCVATLLVYVVCLDYRHFHSDG